MRNRAWAPSIAFLGLAAILWSLPINTAAYMSHTPFVRLSLPAAVVDVSDLDLRDRWNRPIKSSQATAEMKRLFVQSLNDHLLFNLTPGARALRARLQRETDPWRQLFQAGAVALAGLVHALVSLKKSLLKPDGGARGGAVAAFRPPPPSTAFTGNAIFLHFLSLVVSSTRLLR